ncbi:MAG: (2Fe-2S)-binding protein [Spirochaetes bacterium GWD1_61_31]|nr:MAG: (2Fe-2S)-binding protein [Spirochaetes bacterium GWB1_60_80]OHD33752.1 MAG: (2Fe-2S)-binding protein [Spirochaetes bacterium GWC1_61_12]OHD38975.1 MAG: (2Fe-2S)-binding protein [Spirochaetes bacterium GWD1_61_31]OHD43425.1 MAG: (2Fe-2S)-binding protein [Spirochaetes bacterium GWE1_60_18]OHD58956.1 MAG: (2Fe-2S)-binding protein [Spirochaetes bacterium GWF1_60_12]HAP42637.1 (2Fe-2S)-binding protein [Spirochaetaceae bacterium]
MTIYGPAETIELQINMESIRLAVQPGLSLMRLLRERLGLTGTRCGCENGDCGACTVLLAGVPVKSCMVLAVECAGQAIRTIEGLRDHPLQRAFTAEQGFQCGFCTSGMIMNAVALLEAHPQPDEAADREWLQSNLCRCTGYEGIRRALARARREMAEDRGG